MSQEPKGPPGAGPESAKHTGLTCVPAVAGAASSSLSDSSLLEESSSGPSSGLWVPLATAGEDVQAGKVAVPTRTGGTLADAGAMGMPFLGEALV